MSNENNLADFHERVRKVIAAARGRGIVSKLKAETFAAYGNKCACCGESHEEFLSLDHIGGNKVTPKHAKHHHQEYRYLRDLGYPQGKYRLLCMNCNWATRNGRPCPHQQQRVNKGHRLNSKTASEAARKRWWRDGKPKPVRETGKPVWMEKG